MKDRSITANNKLVKSMNSHMKKKDKACSNNKSQGKANIFYMNSQ